MEEKFQNFFINKFNLQKEFLKCKFSLNFSRYKPSNYSQVAFNEIFKETPQYIQKILINNKEALLLYFKNGSKMIMSSIKNKITCFYGNDCKNYKCLDKKISINKTKTHVIKGKLQKAQNEFNKGKNNNPFNEAIKKINHKDRKLNIQKNLFF